MDNLDEVTHPYIGQRIESIRLENDVCYVELKDTVLEFADDGQSCCEHRYMSSDEPLDYYTGSTFHGVEIRGVGWDKDDPNSDVHEL